MTNFFLPVFFFCFVLFCFVICSTTPNTQTTVRELLNNVNNGTSLDNASLIVVYDQASLNVSSLSDDSCLKVLWTKLISTFSNVRFLKGGFNEFHEKFNGLCTNKAQMLQNHQKKPILDYAISQPW